MSKHRLTRPTRRTRTSSAAVLAVAAAFAGTVAGAPSPASAAIPVSAQKWSSLMRQSLTPSPEYVQLAGTLATQRTALVTRATKVTTGRVTHAAAQSAMTTAVTTDATARTRLAVAVEALTSAKNNRTVALQRRPRNVAAENRAQTAVTTAATLVTTRRAEARQAAAVLRTARTASATATTDLDTATVAWQTTSDRIKADQAKLATLDTDSAELAARAAALSRQVVTETRATFTTADATTVNGITVHKSVAFAFRQMLADAKADGIVLSGGGFRTKQRQIELRKINGCPDVYTAPASSCRVPTAIPGRSLHEIGMAVDITQGGRTLTAGSSGFKWLVANAGEYGFVNLPSEAWHWSITGG